MRASLSMRWWYRRLSSLRRFTQLKQPRTLCSATGQVWEPTERRLDSLRYMLWNHAVTYQIDAAEDHHCAGKLPQSGCLAQRRPRNKQRYHGSNV